MTDYQIKTFFNKQAEPTMPNNPIVDKFKAMEQNKPKPVQVTTPPQSTVGVAKPLFTPSVKLAMSADENSIIDASLRKLNFTDFFMEVHEKSRLFLLKDAIKIDNHTYISDYGSDINSDDALNQLTAITQATSISEIREYLATIMEKINLVDIEGMREKKASLFASFFNKKVNTKEGFFELDAEIEQLVLKCKQSLGKLKKILPTFDTVDDDTEKQFRKLTVLIIAGQLRLDQEKTKVVPQEQLVDFFAKQNQTDLTESINRFERRIQNLMIIRQTMLLRMSQLRLELKNILSLVDQTTEIVTIVIPTWKQQILTVFSSKQAISNDFFDVLENTQKAMQQKLTNATGANNV